MENQQVLSVENLSKQYGGVHAVQNVSFGLSEGEVLGLIGDNGAGKSTLIKMIAGVLTPTQGTICWGGKVLHEITPKTVRDLGIETVYQDLALADNLEVSANLFLGKELTKKRFGLIEVLDKKTMEIKTKEALGRLNMRLNSIRVPVRDLSGGQRQAVAIGRALFWNAKLFIMDEPTAALGVKERNNFLEMIRLLKNEKVSVIFISHSLPDVFAVTDRILIMRQGRKICELFTAETNEAEVVTRMIGSENDAKRN